MNEIVVARKAKLLAAYISFIVAGALFLGFGIYFAIVHSENFWAILLVCGLMGIGLIAAGIWQIVKYKKTPENLITYKDGLFTFADGTICNPNEITHVLIKLTRQNGVVNSTGGLVVTINGSRKIEYQNIAYVQKVQDVIRKITDEYNAELYRESQSEPVIDDVSIDEVYRRMAKSTGEESGNGNVNGNGEESENGND